MKALLDDGSEGRGYLLKERVADVDELVAPCATVAAGGSAVDPKVVEALVAPRRRRRRARPAQPREREVLAEMAAGQEQRRHRRRRW